MTNVEDLVPVPGTHWVIGSDLAATGQQGYLYLFHSTKDTASAVQPGDIAIKPDNIRYAECPGAPDWKILALMAST